MNNIFSFSRFAMLFKKHTQEHAKNYLLSAAVLAGLIFIPLAFISYSKNGILTLGSQINIFIFFLFLAGCIFTSLSFSALGNKRKAIPVLTLPASHFEKYLVAWLYSFLIYQLVYTGIFYLVDGLVLSLSTPAEGHNQLLNIFNVHSGTFGSFIFFTVFHALAFWGAIFFEKMHFIKTAFVFFAAVIVLVVVNQPILQMLVNKDLLQNTPFGGLRFIEHGKYYNIESQSVSGYFHAAIIAACTLLLWCSAFFRLKEKEV